jgi:hypothetical protein
MKKQITVHTEPCDPHTAVIVRNKYGIQFCQYGEVGEGAFCQYGEVGEGAYFLEHELADVLKSYIPCTDTDRIDLMEKLKFEINRLRGGRYYVMNYEDEDVFPDVFFDTWREAADAVIDQYNNP